MKAVVQRVSSGNVLVGGRTVGQISRGLVVLAAITREDGPADVAKMAKKLAGLRIFPSSEQAPYDLDVKTVDGAVLLVSNFTVAADTSGGRRPSLSPAMPPAEARPVFESLVQALRAEGVPVETGAFGEEMQVTLVNEGPLTVLVDTRD